MPAASTAASTRPHLASASLVALSDVASTLVSPCTVIRRSALAFSAAVALAIDASFRSTRTTLAPAARRAYIERQLAVRPCWLRHAAAPTLIVASPMPLAPPVTMATLPWREVMVLQ